MTIKRPHLYWISIVIVLSVFASPVAACVCSHHEKSDARESSGHHSHKKEVSHHQHSHDHVERSGEGSANTADSSDECACISPAPKAAAKSESLNLKKHVAAISAIPSVAAVIAHGVEIPEITASALLLIQDPFYGSHPSRGPPVS